MKLLRVAATLTAVLLCQQAMASRSPFHDDSGSSSVGSSSTSTSGAATCGSATTSFDVNGVAACYPTSDAALAKVGVKSRSAYPTAATNTTGADLLLAAGQGSTKVTIATAANCATDTVTVTINGVANVLTEGTNWTKTNGNNSATCTSLATAIAALTGIDSTLTVCSAAVLPIYLNSAGYDLSVATSDATCDTVANGTDGKLKLHSTLDALGNLIYSSTVALNLGTAAATGHSLTTGDIILGGKLEVDGTTFLDGAATIAGATTLSSTLVAGAEANGSVAGQYITYPASRSYAPTTFDQHHFLLGRSALTGAGSGSIFFGYDSTDSVGYMGVLSPSVSWRPLLYNKGTPANTGDFILGVNVALKWDNSTTNAAAPSTDTGIKRSAAGVVAATDGSTGNGAFLGSYFSSSTANPSTSGIWRAANNENGECWRNAANSQNLCWLVDASNQLQWTVNGSSVLTVTSGGVILAGSTLSSTGNIETSGNLSKFTTKNAYTTISNNVQTLTCSTSATLATTAAAIPDGAILLGVTTRISTALTGATGFTVGDGSDVDLWGVQAAATLGSTTSNADATATWANPYLNAAAVTLTFAGACITGAVRVTSHYITLSADATN